MTPDEYLGFERAAEIRHEYHDGELIAFAGAKREHILITGNTHYRLTSQLLDTPCEVYMTDMRVKATPTAYVYPNVVVVCDEPMFADDEFDVLLNPTVIVEVLSPSTEILDRRDKLQYYGALESVKDYLLIAQEKIRVDHYVKQSGSEWNLHVYTEPDDMIEIASIGCKLVLSEVYAKVKFSQKPTALPTVKEA